MILKKYKDTKKKKRNTKRNYIYIYIYTCIKCGGLKREISKLCPLKIRSLKFYVDHTILEQEKEEKIKKKFCFTIVRNT